MKRIVVGISGASGMIYAVRLLRAIPGDYQVHLVISPVATKIMKAETGWDSQKQSFGEFWENTQSEPFGQSEIITHSPENHFAPVASGSFLVQGMAVIPCSAKTLSGIANGYASNLIERAADVNLKERRPVVLVLRETPYNLIHIENMKKATLAGATILPASPAFYHKPQTIEQLADFVAARVLDHLSVPHNLVTRWGEN